MFHSLKEQCINMPRILNLGFITASGFQLFWNDCRMCVTSGVVVSVTDISLHSACAGNCIYIFVVI
jgi:hypothetical protein